MGNEGKKKKKLLRFQANFQKPSPEKTIPDGSLIGLLDADRNWENISIIASLTVHPSLRKHCPWPLRTSELY